MKYDITLRGFKIEDADFVNSLRYNDAVENTIGGPKRLIPIGRDRKWIEEIIINNSEKNIYLAITLEGQIIGYISIVDIDFRNGICRVGGIKIDPAFSGKGYGTQAILWTSKYVFEELRMARYQAECLEHNTGSLKMFLKAGFKQEGLIRDVIYKNGTYNNQWLLSIIKSDYEQVKQKFQL